MVIINHVPQAPVQAAAEKTLKRPEDKGVIEAMDYLMQLKKEQHIVNEQGKQSYYNYKNKN